MHASVEEGRAPLATNGALDCDVDPGAAAAEAAGAVAAARRRVERRAVMVAVIGLGDVVLSFVMAVSPFSFNISEYVDSQIAQWSLDSSSFDWVIVAVMRDCAIAALALLTGMKQPDAGAESFVRRHATPIARRIAVGTLLFGLGRLSLLDWKSTPQAIAVFTPTIGLGAITGVMSSIFTHLLMRASETLEKVCAPNADDEAAADDPSDHAQYSSAFTFLQTLNVLRPYFWPSTGEWNVVLANRFRAIMTWVFVGLSKVSNLFGPIFLARATNEISTALKSGAGPQALTTGIVVNLAIYALLIFFSKAMKEAQSLVYIKVQQAAYIEIADRTFKHLHSLSLEWHLKKKMGNVVRSMDRGIQAAQQTMQYCFLYLFPTLAEAIAVTMIFVFHYNNARLAVFIGLNLFMYIYATVNITLWRKRLRTATTKHDNALHDRLTDSLVNYETIKYFTAERYEQQEYRNTVQKFQEYSMATQASLSLLNVVQQIIVNFALAGGMIIATARVLDEHGELGDFVAVNAYIINVFTPLNFLGTIYNMVVTAIVDMHNFGQMLAEKPEVQDKPGATELDPNGRAWVEFQKVSFNYKKQTMSKSIQDVSFRVECGQSLALVGPTGAGKTTVTRLLFRFYEATAGDVKINDINVKEITQRSLRKAIGMVPQDVVMFNASIAHNIKYGLLGASDVEVPMKVDMHQVEKAADNAQLSEFIQQQAEGFETIVGERGLKLSGGEKQRLAIARCFLKNPPLVVLDEATSALDSETEQKIQTALDTLSKSRTVVAIAHRLSTIRHFDNILVLESGKVVESGKHDDLMARDAASSRYVAMWQRQAAGIFEEAPTKSKEEAPVVELALAWVVAMLPLQMGMVTEEGRAMAGATAMATAEGTATEGATGEATEEGMEEDMAAK
eukprot:CAMPEP_0115330774 /NCGR_PEP_ID=MMETSP0270-20121206/85959_1 /TAXON_ID=71861 /ORGANISM="Scrippsiella trochoidea, Strain CCMP3099" /LENGTH=900 /DNA_ID=CAMNT_0002751517 /DNA_START=81 /DNA_END=2784 /DNA_ORIENTATION=-